MFNAFVREKPSRVLLVLKDQNSQWHLSKIARETGTSYVYVTKFVSSLARKGFVTIEPKGKLRLVKLTEKGMETVSLIEQLKTKLV
jgi:predicted transcriptional regulator